jgi:hypothetical protein
MILIWFSLILIVTAAFMACALFWFRFKTGIRSPLWKKLLAWCLLVVSFLPWATIVFLAPPLAYLNIAYFFIVWTLFHTVRLVLPITCYIAAPIMFGLVLVTPLSSFVQLENGHFSLLPHKTVTDLFIEVGKNWKDFPSAVYSMAFAVLPLLGTHFLLRRNDIGPHASDQPRQ